MKEFNGFLFEWLNRVKSDRTAREDEYVGDDNFLYCKNCKTKRDYRFIDNEEGFEIDEILRCKCQCQIEKENKNELLKNNEEFNFQVNIEKKKAYAQSSLYSQYNLLNDDKKSPKITNLCNWYINNFEKLISTQNGGQGLIFWGNVGTGKTFFAVSIANGLLEKGKKARIVKVNEVIDKAKDFKNWSNYYSDLFNADIIVLDDLGTEQNTPFVNKVLYDLIDTILNRKKLLIITTNYSEKTLLTLSQLSSSNDDFDWSYPRIFSRILEKCTPVEINEIARRHNNIDKNKEILRKMLKGDL